MHQHGMAYRLDLKIMHRSAPSAYHYRFITLSLKGTALFPLLGTATQDWSFQTILCLGTPYCGHIHAPWCKQCDLQGGVRITCETIQRHVQYNGCKWLGGLLRVEPAKPDYNQRLAREAAQDQAQEADLDLGTSSGAAEVLQLPEMSQDIGPIHLPSRDGRKVSL